MFIRVFKNVFANGSQKTSVMNGLIISGGYKQFFGSSKKFGLRYNAFFEYAHAATNGVLMNQSGGNYITDGNNRSKRTGYDMFNYGVGIDALYNFVNEQKYSFGVFGGLSIGGTGWGFSGKASQAQYFKNDSNIDSYRLSGANFQVMADFGVRTNFSKHQGFEVGMKLPFIPVHALSYTSSSPNGTGKTYDKTNNYVKRDFSVYVSYVWNF